MRLAGGVEWALHCCAVLGGLDEGESLAAADLAALYDLSPSYFAKAVQALSAAGIVTSARGKVGGYALARPADAVTMLDVVDAVDGEPTFRCTEIRKRGPVSPKMRTRARAASPRRWRTPTPRGGRRWPP